MLINVFSSDISPSCAPVCRQLSKEHLDLQGVLDRQTGLCQRLTQEKEQLMFKLKHRDSCPTFPSFPIVSEISPS